MKTFTYPIEEKEDGKIKIKDLEKGSIFLDVSKFLCLKVHDGHVILCDDEEENASCGEFYSDPEYGMHGATNVMPYEKIQKIEVKITLKD